MNRLLRHALLLLFFVLLAATVFRSASGERYVFSGSDANIGLLEHGKRMIPERFLGAFYPAPLLGGASNMALSASNFGKALLSPALFSDTWYSIYLLIASLALIGYLRLWNLGWLSAVFGALAAIWVGSITLATAGHLYKLGTMAFFCVALLCIELSVRSDLRRSIGYALLAGWAVGLMLLEQQDVGLLAGLFLGSYTLFRLVTRAGKALRAWLAVLLPVGIIGLGLSLSTALNAYTANVVETELQEDPDRHWNFVTQWSMVPSELPDLIAPGYTGWSSGDPKGPYWGKIGRAPKWGPPEQAVPANLSVEDVMRLVGNDGRNFRLDSLYIGFIPLFLAGLGTVLALGNLRRRSDPAAGVFLFWTLSALVALVLACGKYSVFYKPFFHLPLVGNIRAPIKLLHNFQVIVGILAAYGLHGLLTAPAESRARLFRWALIVCGTFSLLLLVAGGLAGAGGVEKGFARDWGSAAPVIAGHISRSLLHAGLMGLLLAAVIAAAWKTRGTAVHVALQVLLLGAVAGDSVYLTSQYFKAEDLHVLRRSNEVLRHIKAGQGEQRTFCLSQDGVYNLWISHDFLYHGVHGYNFGQMPRMPADYKAFLGAVWGNWPRMMQLTSCKYALAPASTFVQLQRDPHMSRLLPPEMFFRFAMVDGRASAVRIPKLEYASDQVLLRHQNAFPRFALFPDWVSSADTNACARLASPAFDPSRKLLLSETTPLPAGITPSPGAFVPVEIAHMSPASARIRVKSDTGGILLFTQRYQSGWTASINGTAAPLLKCNFLNLGVHVPPGEHEVVFTCPRQPGPLLAQGLAMLAAGGGALFLLRPFRKRKPEVSA